MTICKKTERRENGKRGPRHAGWWLPELAAARSRVRALRRRFQGEQDSDLRKEKKVIYKKEFAKYRKKIILANKNHLRDFLERVVLQNPFGAHYKIAKDKMKQREVLGPIQKDNDSLVLEQDEIEKEILGFHFKYISERNIEDYQNEEEIEITEFEVENVLKEMKVGKAPGYNGLELDIYQTIFLVAKDWFVKVLNVCFQSGIFPDVWKKAKVILFLKEGKDKSKCESYRPICLLPVWGKILDKIITKRLIYISETRGLLSRNQYGFRKGMSTQDAVKVLLDVVDENKRAGNLTCLISFDIKNAFNGVRKYDLSKILQRCQIPRKLYNICR